MNINNYFQLIPNELIEEVLLYAVKNCFIINLLNSDLFDQTLLSSNFWKKIN